MARYTSDSKERVRDAIDFVELVNARTELRKSGQRRYTGLCPFHDERTPSFGIDPVEKLYHCFGCGEGGDVFKFVMETEGLDFASTLESLAERAGVELEAEEEDPRAAKRRDREGRLLALLERTAAYYVRVLWESGEAADAREYLLGRGLTEGALRQFRVGYSPSAWDTVLNASRRAGYANEEVFAAGLATRGREGRIYDVFRGKVMFPLADRRGRVRGFGARAMRDGQGPKYVNTRESEVFSKGRQLFGIDVARAAAAKAGSVVLAEGYTDVIALHQAGFGNAVGVMGTALTAEQAREIGGLASVVLLCLDADAAGQQAAVRAASVLPDRLELRVVGMPAGSDPADVVGEEGGAERMRGLLDRAVPFARFQIERTLEGARDDEALSAVGAVIKPMPQGILRDELVKLASSRLGISPELVESAIRSARPPAAGSAGDPPPRAPNDARQALDRREQSERAFLALCVALPELGEAKLAAADLDALFTSPLARLAAERLRGHLEHPASVIGDAPELAELIPEIVLRGGQLDATPATLELEALQLDLHRLDREITAARTGDEAGVHTLAAERQRVLDAIRHKLL
ncbi:MAG TPA: DNA primase [Solirubrobacteraceae bacterium]|nr:DNA primase [Solirubrobacteraceae bacterium]